MLGMIISCAAMAQERVVIGKATSTDDDSTNLDYGYGISDASTVTIGSQEWISKNLNVERFANGDTIPQAKTPEEWKSAADSKQPAWCYYNNDPANGSTYGKLYNWYAVNDPRGLAPKGWHIPSDSEWDDLIRYLAGDRVEVNKPEIAKNGRTYYATKEVGSLLKSMTGWSEGGHGNNTSSFTGLPGGSRYPSGRFASLGEYGDWWSSSESTSEKAIARYMNYRFSEIFEYDYDKGCGFSVRCLKDLSPRRASSE